VETITLEVGKKPDAQTKFDIWTVCDAGITVEDILNKLESTPVLPFIQSGSLFSSSVLNALSVPFTHLNHWAIKEVR
jgi:hypothetical protein